MTPVIERFHPPPTYALPGPGGAVGGSYINAPCYLKGWSIRSSGTGTGLTQLAVPQPAVASPWTFTLPGALVLTSIFATLATDATAQSITPVLTVTNPSAVQWLAIESALAQAQSLTHTYTWAPGVASTSVNVVHPSIGIPALSLPAGTVIADATANMTAGDQWSNIVISGVADISSSDDGVVIYNGQSAAELAVAYPDPSEGDGTTTWLEGEGLFCNRGLFVVATGDISSVVLYARYAVDYPVG